MRSPETASAGTVSDGGYWLEHQMANVFRGCDKGQGVAPGSEST